MIQHNPLSEKYQHQLLAAFSALKLSQHLRKAGICKAFGLSSLRIFQILFQLVFQGRNLFRLLEGPAAESLPGKDVIYRFLNEPCYNWRRFLQSLSLQIVERFDQLTSAKRVLVFVLDDSVVSRNRSKQVELLARI
jgi:hypothetical protein